MREGAKYCYIPCLGGKITEIQINNHLILQRQKKMEEGDFFFLKDAK